MGWQAKAPAPPGNVGQALSPVNTASNAAPIIASTP